MPQPTQHTSHLPGPEVIGAGEEQDQAHGP